MYTDIYTEYLNSYQWKACFYTDVYTVYGIQPGIMNARINRQRLFCKAWPWGLRTRTRAKHAENKGSISGRVRKVQGLVKLESNHTDRSNISNEY